MPIRLTEDARKAVLTSATEEAGRRGDRREPQGRGGRTH